MHRAVLTGGDSVAEKTSGRGTRGCSTRLVSLPLPASSLPTPCFLNKRKVLLYALITRVGIFSEDQECATTDERMHIVQGETRDCGRFAFQT